MVFRKNKRKINYININSIMFIHNPISKFYQHIIASFAMEGELAYQFHLDLTKWNEINAPTI